MLITEKFEVLLAYYHFSRRRGHTHAMVHGAIHTPNPIILTATEHDKTYIKHYLPPENRATFVSWDDLEYLRGRNSPMLIDNHAMMRILTDALTVISDLEKRNIELTQRINKMIPHYYESR